ncbi:MAG: NADH-quinone oxidoreductase subunit C [Patescibacteria group bacterium]
MNKEIIKQYLPDNVDVNFFANVAVFEIATANIKEVVNFLRNDKNLSLKLVTATDERKDSHCFKIWYVFGLPKENIFIVPFIKLEDTLEFPSVALACQEALNYERKIQTFFGLVPVGHTDPRSIILHENWPANIFPLRKDFDWQSRPAVVEGTYQFNRVKGEGIYEIPVGPIHAGIIEPGHFRFSVAGETIVSLEPRLGFTHKGSEKLFEHFSLADSVRLAEKISGDSSLSHSLAFCQTIESLADLKLPKRAAYLRVIFAELERLANHFGDIGAIMLDTGFNFGGAQGSRLREMIMQINERLTGSRFLRSVNTIGGVQKDLTEAEISQLAKSLEIIAKDFSEVIEIAENSSSLVNRLQDTGKLTQAFAKSHGVVGVAARATGIGCDTRADFPYAAYQELFLDRIETENTGDVCARFYVRIKEVRASIAIIDGALKAIPKGLIKTSDTIVLKKNACAIALVEGWRGEILYFITTDAQGQISRVVPRDPSFLNWNVLGKVGVNNIVPDFPLINKSFNLSYTGNDL